MSPLAIVCAGGRSLSAALLRSRNGMRQAESLRRPFLAERRSRAPVGGDFALPLDRDRASGLRDGQTAGLGSPAPRIVDGDRDAVAGLVLVCREVGPQPASVDKLRVLIDAVRLYARLLNKP
jgi:hypothetical protein